MFEVLMEVIRVSAPDPHRDAFQMDSTDASFSSFVGLHLYSCHEFSQVDRYLFKTAWMIETLLGVACHQFHSQLFQMASHCQEIFQFPFQEIWIFYPYLSVLRNQAALISMVILLPALSYSCTSLGFALHRDLFQVCLFQLFAFLGGAFVWFSINFKDLSPHILSPWLP